MQACGTVMQACGNVIQACGPVMQACGNVMQACGSVIHECGNVMQACGSVIHECLKPLKLTTSARLALCRTELVGELYSQHGFHDGFVHSVILDITTSSIIACKAGLL